MGLAKWFVVYNETEGECRKNKPPLWLYISLLTFKTRIISWEVVKLILSNEHCVIFKNWGKACASGGTCVRSSFSLLQLNGEAPPRPPPPLLLGRPPP